MVGRRFGWAVVVVLLLALALRLGYVALTPGYAIVDDARDYDTHARSIAAGDGFPRPRAPRRRGLPPPRPRAVAGDGVPAAGLSDPPRRRLRAHRPRDEGRRAARRRRARRERPRRDGDRRADRRARPAAVRPPRRARGDGARGGLPAAGPRRRSADVRAAVRRAPPRR